MEGILYKWTNYWNGWQSRWFHLDKGVLAYYKSQEDMTQGCKGSVQLSACEIIVHPTDTLRIDIIIPYEQYFYLRAPSQHERHAWLVALSNAKAGLPPAIPKTLPAAESKCEENIKSKKSELRLTCDLLMKQVYDVKTASCNPEGPDIQKLDDATILLSATCDSFIHILEECMHLTNASMKHHMAGEALIPQLTILTKERKFSNSSKSHTRRKSSER